MYADVYPHIHDSYTYVYFGVSYLQLYIKTANSSCGSTLPPTRRSRSQGVLHQAESELDSCTQELKAWTPMEGKRLWFLQGSGMDLQTPSVTWDFHDLLGLNECFARSFWPKTSVKLFWGLWDSYSLQKRKAWDGCSLKPTFFVVVLVGVKIIKSPNTKKSTQ